jgi:hypothetical protein
VVSVRGNAEDGGGALWRPGVVSVRGIGGGVGGNGGLTAGAAAGGALALGAADGAGTGCEVRPVGGADGVIERGSGGAGWAVLRAA